jgi:uncharacterized protein
MPNPVVHFEIISKDAEKLHSFYSDVFDWKVDADNPGTGRSTTVVRG